MIITVNKSLLLTLIEVAFNEPLIFKLKPFGFVVAIPTFPIKKLLTLELIWLIWLDVVKIPFKLILNLFIPFVYKAIFDDDIHNVSVSNPIASG